MAGLATAQLLHLIERIARLIEQRFDVMEQRATSLRQRHGAGGAFEQLHPQLAFQLFDMFAERRLGHVQPLCGLGKVHLLRHHAEIVQQAKVDPARVG